MIFVTQESDIKIVDSGIQMIYFYDSRVIFHRHMILCMEYWEKEQNNQFLAIDLEYFHNQSKRFGVTILPTFILFKDGREFSRLEGSITDQIFNNTFGDIFISEPLNGAKYE